MALYTQGLDWHELCGRNYSKVKEKDLGVTMKANMKVSEQCRIAEMAMLGFRRNLSLFLVSLCKC